MDRPLVSVVTPFFNTAAYLAECIGSVLAQTYADFEYILMDNCSTDGSSGIAAAYARRDRRIRLISCSEFLPQLPNYNRALAEISADSKYCKMVQADDWIFPRCLELMVETFERSESIGMVGSYWLYGKTLCGEGLPYQIVTVNGEECARQYLRTCDSIFGTQTQVMYRSSLVRNEVPFFNVAFPSFADIQRHLDVLRHWDFGFVHQLLSFSRSDNESILRGYEPLKPYQLLSYVLALRYAPIFLEAEAAASLVARRKREYYRVLARATFLLPGAEFWRFHKLVLKTFNEGERHNWGYLTVEMLKELLWLASSPGMAATRALHALKRDRRRRIRRQSSSSTGGKAAHCPTPNHADE